MDEIKAALSEKLGSKVAFEIPLFGGIPVPQSALVTWVIIALLTVFAIWLTHGLQKKPGRRQMVAELMVGFINNFCKGTLGEKHWRTFAPYPRFHRAIPCGFQPIWAGRRGPSHKRPERDRWSGRDECCVNLWCSIPVPWFRRWTQKVRTACSDLSPTKRYGDWDSATLALSSSIWQCAGRIHHHGADQNGGPRRASSCIQLVL